LADSTGKKIYKIARWAVLLALVLVIVFALKKPDPPAPPLPPQAVKEQAQQFESKLQQIETAQQNGNPPDPDAMTFTSNEVNAFIQDATERAKAEAARSGVSGGTAQDEVKNTQVAFTGDEVITQAVTERYGRDVYVTVRGRLAVENGYLRFQPTAFKVGDLSVPVSLVDPTLQKKLNEPEMREKLKLPDFIREIRVENGQLVIVPK
jgi:hemolysin activation/secretion protein